MGKKTLFPTLTQFITSGFNSHLPPPLDHCMQINSYLQSLQKGLLSISYRTKIKAVTRWISSHRVGPLKVTPAFTQPHVTRFRNLQRMESDCEGTKLRQITIRLKIAPKYHIWVHAQLSEHLLHRFIALIGESWDILKF